MGNGIDGCYVTAGADGDTRAGLGDDVVGDDRAGDGSDVEGRLIGSYNPGRDIQTAGMVKRPRTARATCVRRAGSAKVATIIAA